MTRTHKLVCLNQNFGSKITKNSAESPRYTLIELKKEPEARDTLVKLRGTDNVSSNTMLRK